MEGKKSRVAAQRATQWRKDNVLRDLKNRGLPVPTRRHPEKCECCGNTDVTGEKLCIDHDHETGAFRGWLCRKCNAAIGMLGDSVTGLLMAVKYLETARQGTEQEKPLPGDQIF